MRARRVRVVGMSTQCSGRHKGTRRPPWAGRGWRAHVFNHNHCVCYVHMLVFRGIRPTYLGTRHCPANAGSGVLQLLWMITRFCLFCYFGFQDSLAPSLTRPPTPEGRGERCVAVRFGSRALIPHRPRRGWSPPLGGGQGMAVWIKSLDPAVP